MEDQKIYRIDEILVAAANWLENPEGEEENKVFSELKTNLVIRAYMPIGQKDLLLKKAIIDMRTDTDSMPHTETILYEITLLFDCLLAYIVNLDQNISTIYKDANFYDMLKLSGLVDYILSFCEKDYNLLCHMAERMISFDNLRELASNLEISSPEQVERLTREFERFTTETSPEMIKALGNMAALSDPLLTNIKKNIEEEAYIASQTNNQQEE